MEPTLAQVTPADPAPDPSALIPVTLAVVQSVQGYTGKTWPQIAAALDKDNTSGIRASIDAQTIAQLIRVLLSTGVIQ